MTNLFPRTITAGLTLDAPVTLSAYPPPSWQLTAVLRGPKAITLSARHEGKAHRFHAVASETSLWSAGNYLLSLRAARTDGTVVELYSDTVTIRPDIELLGDGHDARGHVQRVLDAIEAVLEKRATLDQEEYRINNRELRRTPIGELLKLRDRYRAELARMEAGRRGSLFLRSVKVAFR